MADLTGLDHIDETLKGATDAVVADAITYVKNHPDYERIVQALGNKALAAITAGL